VVYQTDTLKHHNIIPASPLWRIAVETAERTVAAWKTLEHKDVVPKQLRDSIDKQILGVAAAIK
jgi:hypothetical protein